MEDRGVEQRIGAIARGVGKTLVAPRSPAGSVVFLSRARRERTGERLDASAGHIDHRHCCHTDDGAFEHAMAERAPGILGTRNSERTTYVLAAGVAGRRLLRELLHRRLDGEVD